MFQLQSRALSLALLYGGLCCSLNAVDGVVLIDQNRALAGNVTPGDTPGFPVTISQAGSYRLSGNLTVPNAATTAIEVTADNVSIDLNGFSLFGPLVCIGSPVTSCNRQPSDIGRGVRSVSTNVRVVNGSIHGMGFGGVDLSGIGSYVEKMLVDSNGQVGILVSFGVVIGNTASRNGSAGITIANSAAVSGNNSVLNKEYGYIIHCPTAMIANTAYLNGTGNVFTIGIPDPTSPCSFTGNAP